MASTPARDLQDEILAAARKSQENVVRAIRNWLETVRSVTPNFPSVYAPLADRLPKLPSVNVPFADKLPKPQDVVASGYEFAEQLLALQRKFAEDLLDATAPLIPGHSKGPKAAPAAKSQPAPVPAAPTPAAPESAAPKPAPPKAEPKPAVTESAAKAVATPSTPVAPKA